MSAQDASGDAAATATSLSRLRDRGNAAPHREIDARSRVKSIYYATS